ncbi:sugar kinase [Thermocladium modestius]|uniref:Sugar kinase n=1 Tax=Thermocladium modestius TaxID=62609 RepID=A0A830GVE4_9CREN|nr:carbohydrate kinase family protein [Thermocladium modestius]GGP20334.1 sugar kinase [Thermocladium modestius]
MPNHLFDLIVVSDCVLDIYYIVDKLPIGAGDFVVSRRTALSPGGACATALLARRLGLEVAVIDEVGDDPFSEALIGALKDAGVNTGFMRRIHGFTTVSNDIISSDGHAFVGYLGVGAGLDLRDLDENALRGSRAVFINGTYAALSGAAADALMELARMARRSSLPVFLDPGPVINERTRRLVEEADVVLPNEEEVKSLFHASLEEAIHAIRNAGKVFAIKLGRGGAVVIDGNRTIHCGPSSPRSIITTVGAGDAFNAGYVAGMLRGLDPIASCRLANAVASLRLEHLTPLEVPDLGHLLHSMDK